MMTETATTETATRTTLSRLSTNTPAFAPCYFSSHCPSIQYLKVLLLDFRRMRGAFSLYLSLSRSTRPLCPSVWDSTSHRVISPSNPSSSPIFSSAFPVQQVSGLVSRCQTFPAVCHRMSVKVCSRVLLEEHSFT